jgi:hypothetical protein
MYTKIAASHTGGVAYAQEKNMPQIIDVPEAVQEERWQRHQEQTVPQSPMIETQRERTRVYASLRAVVGSLMTRHLHPRADVIHTNQPFELPIDRTAREYPFLFTTAMSG